MQFTGFTQEGLDFLLEIELNNTKIWFEDNRHRWEKYILSPNKAYVEEMGEHLLPLAPLLKALPKASGSLFKIYRDTRFSHDKTPMKTKIGIIFWQGPNHRMSSPCFYLQYKIHEVYIATGLRVFKDGILKSYREYIKVEKNARILHELLEKYKAKGFKLSEAKYKRLPAGFDKENQYSYLALYAGLFIYTTYKPNKTFLSPRVLNKHYKFYDETHELFDWIYEFLLYANQKD